MKSSYQGSVEKVAEALATQVNVSPKAANEVCYKVRGMMVEKALKYLERVLNMEDFIPYRRHMDGKGHRTKGIAGAYPVKATKIVKKLLESAKANAEFKNLNPEKLKIIHATAYKSLTLDRVKSKGKAKPSRIDLTNIEIAVREV